MSFRFEDAYNFAAGYPQPKNAQVILSSDLKYLDMIRNAVYQAKPDLPQYRLFQVAVGSWALILITDDEGEPKHGKLHNA